jgi:hypothetical protein
MLVILRLCRVWTELAQNPIAASVSNQRFESIVTPRSQSSWLLLPWWVCAPVLGWLRGLRSWAVLTLLVVYGMASFCWHAR